MRIGLIAVDSKYPNLALMKISQWHKGQRDEVEWYDPLGNYDRVYMSKIFSYTPDYEYCISNVKEVRKKRGRNKYLPFCQPFRDINNPNQIIPQWQKDLARWVNRKELFLTHDFKDFEPRKGFKCASYFSVTEQPSFQLSPKVEMGDINDVTKLNG